MLHQYILDPGTILADKYVIHSVIGQGGMSNVYLAYDQRLNKKWAVKEISPFTCRNYEVISETLIAEADILTRLDHPSLPRIVDIFQRNYSMIIVMDYIEGRNLSDLLNEEGMFGEDQVIAWGIELTKVLGYLHGRRPPVIYRDMKPSNIMLKDNGKLILIDFGTAREYSLGAKEDTICLGTLGYAAPEQYQGRDQTDIRTDIYGLGVTLYQLLTGRSPTDPPYKILPVTKLVAGTTEGLERVIEKCTRADPDQRYGNMEEVRYALTHLEENSGAYRKREQNKVKAAGVLVIMMAVFFLTGLVFQCRAEGLKKKLILYYLDQASFAVEEKTQDYYYIRALETAPDRSEIYQTILEAYAGKEGFSEKDEAAVISLVSTPASKGTSLEVLKEKDPKAYVRFTYGMGIACFYEMGGRRGKTSALKWFSDTVKCGNPSMGQGKYERARAYLSICEYYRDYIDKGDKNGEKGKSYGEFFEVLQNLNGVEITMDSDEAEIAAVYCISREVLMEIIQYTDRFTGDNVSVRDLRQEIRRITGRSTREEMSRMDVFREKRSHQDYMELEALVQDAERKITLEDQSEKEERR